MKTIHVILILVLAMVIFIIGNQAIYDYRKKKQEEIDQSYLPQL